MAPSSTARLKVVNLWKKSGEGEAVRWNTYPHVTGGCAPAGGGRRGEREREILREREREEVREAGTRATEERLMEMSDRLSE